MNVFIDACIEMYGPLARIESKIIGFYERKGNPLPLTRKAFVDYRLREAMATIRVRG